MDSPFGHRTLHLVLFFASQWITGSIISGCFLWPQQTLSAQDCTGIVPTVSPLKWTLFRVPGGWELGFVHNKAELGSKLSLCCDSFCWHTWKKKSIGILQSIASFSWLLLPHPTGAVIWREREIEREFVVNRCWSKPKCHTDTDLAAPSGQEVLSWPGVAFVSYP